MEIIFSYYVACSIKCHVYFSGYFCFSVPFTLIFAEVMPVPTGVGGYGWPVSSRLVVRMDAAFWQFSKNTPNSNSVDDVMMFVIILYFACNGPFLWGRCFYWCVIDWFWSKGSISTCSDTCLWFWDIGFIWIYMEDNSAYYIFCHCV